MSNCGCESKNYIISCCTEPKLGPIQNYYTKFVIDKKLGEISSAITEVESEIPSLSGYATQEWVLDQHYITGVDLTNYATIESLNEAISSLQSQINTLRTAISGCCGGSSGKKYTATTTADTVYYKDCASAESCEQDPIGCHELIPHEIIQRIGLLKEVIVGDCVYVTNSSVFDAEINLEKVTVSSAFTAFKGIPFKGCTSMKELVINATTPPWIEYGHLFELDPYDVEQIPANFKIYVPSESVNTYKTDVTWSRYENIIEAIA